MSLRDWKSRTRNEILCPKVTNRQIASFGIVVSA